jgi:hypothetical protein
MQTIGLLFKVLWSPGETMFLLSKNPRVLAPLLFSCLFSFASGTVMAKKLDLAELTIRQIERSPQASNLSDQQKDLMRQQMNSPLVKGFTFVSTAVGPIVIILLVTVIYFVLFTILGREGGFKSFVSITAFAFIPLIFRQLAGVLSALFLPSSAIMLDELGSLSPAVFLDRDSMSPVVFAAVSTVDLVSIWILALLIIGYGFVTRKSLSKGTRAASVIGVFLVFVALRLALAAIRGV